jgi:hypothetical protein
VTDPVATAIAAAMTAARVSSTGTSGAASASAATTPALRQGRSYSQQRSQQDQRHCAKNHEHLLRFNTSLYCRSNGGAGQDDTNARQAMGWGEAAWLLSLLEDPMKRVMLVGLDPATVDFSDPALPRGMSAEKMHAGVKAALADMAARGWQAENCFINPDETAVPTVVRRLAEGRYDCVVIGAGVRLPSNRLVLFEALINAIHRAAPGVPIAFNTRPEDTGAAAARWI